MLVSKTQFPFGLTAKAHDSAVSYLDAYFKMNKDGLITADLNTKIPTLQRTYTDREYFKLLSNKNNDYHRIVRAVFSRDKNEYQWVYAATENNGIKGFTFRPWFSEKIIMPPGTDYLIADKNGNVLMQSDPQKNMYQKLLQQTEDNEGLQNVLSGNYTGAFKMKYQGIAYQANAIKLDVLNDLPIYIISLRDLSFIDRLSIFTFSNGFLISIAYSLFVLTLMLFYSAIMHAGNCSFFSRKHFYYLFPDYSRNSEYRFLILFNIVSIIVAVIVSLIVPASKALVYTIFVGINTAFFNFVWLNRKKELRNIKAYSIGAIIILTYIPILLVNETYPFGGISLLFISHLLIIAYIRCKKLIRHEEIKEHNPLKRRAYNRFITSILLNHFSLFPFILCSSIYVTELNDFSNWHCSVVNQKEDRKSLCIIPFNGCDCNNIIPNTDHDLIRKADLHILGRPASKELSKFSILKVLNGHYLNGTIIYEFEIVAILIIVSLLLVVITYSFINYYGNRFFFYDLMLAYRNEPSHKYNLQGPSTYMPNDKNIYELIENKITKSTYKKNNIDTLSTINIMSNNLSVLERENFIILMNIKKYDDHYNAIWLAIPSSLHNVLFDFARDNFVNYKNKTMIIDLMDRGIIDCDIITGRLRIMNQNFGRYILIRSKQDKNFITEFVQESQGGLFGKLKLPIIIVVVSTLVLLMYLNKDSYDKIALLGTGISGTLAIVHKLLGFTKST